jgi:hypothetical protein
MTVHRALFCRLDPSSNDGITDKVGIGVTIALDDDPFRFEKIRIPDENSLNPGCLAYKLLHMIRYTVFWGENIKPSIEVDHQAACKG